MADEIRTCARTGCRWPASASLSFRYATRQVWLLDLAARPDPSTYDLCPHHGDSLSVPKGWERVDQRTAKPVVAEPAGRDLTGSYGPTVPRLVEEGAAAGRANRYAKLWRDLPRLAAEVAGTIPAAPGGSEAVEPGRREAPAPGDRGRQLVMPVDPDADADADGVVVPIRLASARRRPDSD